jgi:hypothetical protein
MFTIVDCLRGLETGGRGKENNKGIKMKYIAFVEQEGITEHTESC